MALSLIAYNFNAFLLFNNINNIVSLGGGSAVSGKTLSGRWSQWLNLTLVTERVWNFYTIQFTSQLETFLRKYHHFQLEIGQDAHSFAVKALNLEQEHAIILQWPMVVRVVLVKRRKFGFAITVQVCLQFMFSILCKMHVRYWIECIFKCTASV